MGIFSRLATVIKANINALIGRAEDPEKVLDQLVLDMRGQLAKTKQEVASAIADEKKLRAQVDKEKKAAEVLAEQLRRFPVTLTVSDRGRLPSRHRRRRPR